MKYRILFFILMLILISPKIVFSDCLGCTASYKVKMIFNDGKAIVGYISWNPSQPDDFYNKKTQEYVNGFILTQKNTNLSLDQQFEKWVKIRSFVLEHHRDDAEKLAIYSVELNFYKKIEQYKKAEKCLGDFYGCPEKDLIKFKYSQVERMEFVKQDKHFNTTGGLSIFSEDEVRLLRSKEPKYCVGIDCDMGDGTILCYDEKLTFFDFLKDVLLVSFPDCRGYLRYKGFSYAAGMSKATLESNFEKNSLQPIERKAISDYFDFVNHPDPSFRRPLDGIQELKKKKIIVQFVGTDY